MNRKPVFIAVLLGSLLVAACVMLAASLLFGEQLRWRAEATKYHQEMEGYYSQAKNYFYENQEEFEAIRRIIESKPTEGEGAYGGYSVSHRGITSHFLPCKETVFMTGGQIAFNDEELEVLMHYFRGYDYERLEMLGITSEAQFIMFSKGDYYKQGRYRIVIAPASPPRAYSAQALFAEHLDDNWVIMRLCESPATPHVWIWEKSPTGEIVLADPPYESAP